MGQTDKMMMMFMLFTLMQSCIATRKSGPKSAVKLALAERNPKNLKLVRDPDAFHGNPVTPARPQLRPRNTDDFQWYGAPAARPQLYNDNANTGTPRSDSEASETWATSTSSYSDAYDPYAEKTDFSMEDTDDEPQTESEEKTQGVYTKGELRPRATRYTKGELSPMEKCQQVQAAYNQCYSSEPTRDQFLKFAQKNKKSQFKL